MIFDQVLIDLEAVGTDVEQGIQQTYEKAKVDVGKLVADFGQLWQQSPPPPPQQNQAKAATLAQGPLHQQIKAFVQESRQKKGAATPGQPQQPDVAAPNWANLLAILMKILALFGGLTPAA